MCTQICTFYHSSPRMVYRIGTYDYLWSVLFAVIYVCLIITFVFEWNRMTNEQRHVKYIGNIYNYYLFFYYWLAKNLKKAYVDYKLRGQLIDKISYFKKIFLNSKFCAIMTILFNILAMIVLLILKDIFIDKKITCSDLTPAICFFGWLGAITGYISNILCIIIGFVAAAKKFIEYFESERAILACVYIIHQGRELIATPQVDFVLSKIDALTCLAVFEEECSICTMDGNAGDNQFVTLNCGHKFHLACIREWGGSESVNRHLCPMCRADYTIDGPIDRQINMPENGIVQHPNEIEIGPHIQSQINSTNSTNSSNPIPITNTDLNQTNYVVLQNQPGQTDDIEMGIISNEKTKLLQK